MTDQGKCDSPLGIVQLRPSETQEIKKHFTGKNHQYIRMGPKGYFLPETYQQAEAAKIYNLPLRSDDIFVVTFPRSGTTWTQELVWLIDNNLDYEKANAVPLTHRYPFLESSVFFKGFFDFQEKVTEDNAHNEEELKIFEAMMQPPTELLAATPSPRYIKSHLPLSLLPPSLLDTCKLVYVARDPRDVAVSYYHFTRDNNLMGFVGDFKDYWNYFVNDLVVWSPALEHIKEAWEKRNHPNMLFLFYEELSKDLAGCVRRVADFLGKQYSDEQLAHLSEHLKFDNFKNNKAVDVSDMRSLGIFKKDMKFVRKGKAGGWRQNFDAEMTLQAEKWMADNLKDTDLRFPSQDE